MTSEIALSRADGSSPTVTIYTLKVEETRTKTLAVLAYPQSRQNWNAGPKDTKILDLLRLTRRFNVDGLIIPADRTNINTLFQAGGVIRVVYNGTNYNANFEKLIFIEKADGEGASSQEPEHYEVRVTFIVGENL